MRRDVLKKFTSVIPVLLGADLNAYGVARAFHEEYGAIAQAFGKYPLGTTNHSAIINFTSVAGLSEDEKAVRTLVDFALEHKECELYLFGCTDEYAEMIIRNSNELSKYYFCPCISEDTALMLESKERFYEICEKYSIPHPKTVIFSRETSTDTLTRLGFDYPIVIKPSRSSVYWKHPFDGMEKVYFAHDKASAEKIISDIFASGYDDTLVIQDTIPGGDSKMYVLTSYSGTDGKVKKMCLGHVLLEEHTPKGRGNHVAVITEDHPEITEILHKFLDNIGYVGFSNFDIKFDTRDNTFKVFEINLRQGRSNYYVTTAGQNIAKTVTDDRHGRLSGTDICKSETFWHTVPLPVVYKYVDDGALVKKAKAVIKSSGSRSTLLYKKDMKNPARLFYIAAHNLLYFRKYGKYPGR